MSMEGHNSGAVPADVVRDQIDAMLDSFKPRREELLASEARAVISDNDAVGRAGDLSAMMKVLIDRIQSRRQEIEEPYDQAVNVARRATARVTDELIAARERLSGKVEAFRNDQREKAKKAQEEQRQREQELRDAAAAQAPESTAPLPTPEQSPIALPKVIGDMGSTTSDRKVKVFTIPDPKKVDREVLNHPKVIAAMQQVCRDLYKVRKTIRGVVITDDVKAQVRR